MPGNFVEKRRANILLSTSCFTLKRRFGRIATFSTIWPFTLLLISMLGKCLKIHSGDGDLKLRILYEETIGFCGFGAVGCGGVW